MRRWWILVAVVVGGFVAFSYYLNFVWNVQPRWKLEKACQGVSFDVDEETCTAGGVTLLIRNTGVPLEGFLTSVEEGQIVSFGEFLPVQFMNGLGKLGPIPIQNSKKFSLIPYKGGNICSYNQLQYTATCK